MNLYRVTFDAVVWWILANHFNQAIARWEVSAKREWGEEYTDGEEQPDSVELIDGDHFLFEPEEVEKAQIITPNLSYSFRTNQVGTALLEMFEGRAFSVITAASFLKLSPAATRRHLNKMHARGFNRHTLRYNSKTHEWKFNPCLEPNK